MHLGDIKGKSTAESIVLQFKKEEKRELYKSLLINQQRYHDGGCLEKHMLGRTNHTATLNVSLRHFTRFESVLVQLIMFFFS